MSASNPRCAAACTAGAPLASCRQRLPSPVVEAACRTREAPSDKRPPEAHRSLAPAAAATPPPPPAHPLLPAQDLGKPAEAAIASALECTFLDRVIAGLGLVVTLYDVLSIGEGFVHHSEGAAHYRWVHHNARCGCRAGLPRPGGGGMVATWRRLPAA